MKRLVSRLLRLVRSLYARIALVYLASLLLLSVAAAWVAVSHFDRLSREFQQRMEINLADDLARVMQEPLAQGPHSDAARKAASRIHSINPSLSLFLLDARGHLVAAYADPPCHTGTQVDSAAIKRLLGADPMLPVYTTPPCAQKPGIFSVAHIRYGPAQDPGYLFVALSPASGMSMSSMLRTSSITRALLAAGIVAILLSAAAGLTLFALLTRRFTTLTGAVQRFADGDYGQRMTPGRNDEIGRLARAFNDMAGTIEAQLDALRENDRQRRELVASLSHDFRTPLTSLRGYAEQLRTHEKLSPPTRRAVDAIIGNTQRLTRLAQQLSTLARIDAHEKALRLEPFSLGELAHDVVAKFGPQAQAADVALDVRCTPASVRVNADIALIDRALANLVDNALHATPAGGRVEVTVTAGQEKAIIGVADTGIGISREDIPLVTQRFYRTDAGRRQGDGSGLGLAIVENICERHHTRLTIHSQLGHGTRMQFTLPLA